MYSIMQLMRKTVNFISTICIRRLRGYFCCCPLIIHITQLPLTQDALLPIKIDGALKQTGGASSRSGVYISGVWTRLGCSGLNANILSLQGNVQGCTRRNRESKLYFYYFWYILWVTNSLPDAHIGFLQGFNSHFPTSIPSVSQGSPPSGKEVLFLVRIPFVCSAADSDFFAHFII